MKHDTLVFGASLNPQRYSNKAIRKLLLHKHSVKAFGIKEGTIDGVVIDTQLPDYQTIDTVTLYLNPKRQEQYYDDIIKLNPRRILFNPGTENQSFYKLLEAHNIYYEEACTLVLLATGQY